MTRIKTSTSQGMESVYFETLLAGRQGWGEGGDILKLKV